jgi:hypothetical protein
MKKAVLMTVIIMLGVVTSRAQENMNSDVYAARMAKMLNMDSYRSAQEIKPNEIVSGKVNFSGIAVEAYKLGHPLQLLNPFAPAKYGSPEENVLRDGITEKVLGWKLFSIGF